MKNKLLLVNEFIGNLKGEENIFELLKKSLKIVSETLEIKVIKLCYITNSEEDEVVLYSNDEELYSRNDMISYEKGFKENEIDIKIVMYREKTATIWSEEEKNTLDIISNIIYMTLEKNKIKARIEDAKNKDQQTGIPNFNSFRNFLVKRFYEKNISNYAMIYFNIKNFKLVNNKFGYENATEALIKFTKILYSNCTDDEIVARLGGDNYMALIKKDNLEEFIKLMSRVTIKIDFNNDEIDYNLSAKAGIYIVSGDEESPSEIISKATTSYALCKRYESKDIVFYDKKVDEFIIKEKEVQLKIPNALKNNEFIVFYQPKVNLENYEVIGAEALVRWIHDEKIISPIDFISICEKNGLICELDFYVLNLVCKTIRNWLDNNIEPVRVSVNFSKQHFQSKDTVEKIMKFINKYDIPSEYLEIEFTETAYLDEYENLMFTLGELKKSGLSTSMDDFGIGYSSINLLQDLEFDVLKLDKTFLSKQDSERNKIICENIVKMSKELSMDIISEGVETVEQVEFLKKIGCNKAQGYLFDKPLNLEQFEERLQNKKYK